MPKMIEKNNRLIDKKNFKLTIYYSNYNKSL